MPRIFSCSWGKAWKFGDELASHVKIMYTAMREFNLGMAVEFLFSVSIQRNIMTAMCRGSDPRPVALSTRAKTCDETFTLQCDNYIVQQKIEDNLMTVTEPGCHLVKLCECHPAIDFLVVDNSAGKCSRRLFLIQVSAVKYQKRDSNKKVDAVLQPNVTNKQTPVDFYCTKTGVEKKCVSLCLHLQKYQ